MIRKPNSLYSELVLTFDEPCKVYDSGGYDNKRQAAELYLCLVPQRQLFFDLLFYIYGVLLYPSQRVDNAAEICRRIDFCSFVG